MRLIKWRSLLMYILLAIVGVVLLFFIYIAIDFALTHSSMKQLERNRITASIKSRLPEIADSLFYGFDRPIEEVGDQLIRENGNVVRIVIEGEGGRRFLFQRPDSAREGALLHERFALVKNGERIGELRLDYRPLIARYFFERYRENAIIAALILFFFMIGIFRFLYKKIAALTAYAERLERLDVQGGANPPRPAERYYEIRFIANAVERLLKNLNSYAANLKAVNRRLMENERRLVSAQRIARMTSWTYLPTKRKLEVTGEFFRLLELKRQERDKLGLRLVLQSIHPEDRRRFFNLLKEAYEKGSVFSIQHRIVTQKGKIRHIRTEGRVRKSRRREVEVIGVSMDVTEEVEAKKQAERMAYYDPLTGLLNRRAFIQRCEYLIKLARRKGQKVAIVFIDLDGFKNINDSYGHPVGDALLVEVSRTLRRLTRQTDLVGRLGGDEFVIVYTELKDESAVPGLARKVMENITRDYEIEGHSFKTTASIGVSLFPDHSQNVDELLRFADAAMYEAKNAGKNRWRLFDERIRSRIVEQHMMIDELKKALRRDDEIVLYFQPQIDLQSGLVRGAEVLTRWHHPNKGILTPARYIPLIESNTLMADYDNYVLRMAFLQLQRWQKEGKRWSLGVNLSARQFNDVHLIETLKGMVRGYDVDPSLIELEITESLPMEDMQTAIEMLRDIKALGFRIGIDDFGTGYSSLSYLRKLPFDTIKIDREFIKEMHKDEEDVKIVRLIIQIAKALEKEVVAEGPEREEHVTVLKALACDYAQGFYYSKPVQLEAFEKFAKMRQALA